MLRIQGWKVELGQFLPRMDMSVAAPVCVIGHTVGRELFSTGSPIGKWLRIGEMRCRVIGVLSQLGVSHGFDADETVILPVASAQQLFDTPSVFRILVEVRNIDVVDRAQRDITRIIRARHQGELDFTVITQDAVVATFDSILRMITLGLAGIAAISLVVAGVLIMNVMLVAVSQRTTEIGLLKALGARRAQIVALFLAEAASLSLLGAVAGVALGGAGALILGIVFPALEFVPPAWAVAMAVAIAVSSGMVFGILPARRAARLDPVTALARH
jgi:putative ABC transport system permease protein